MKKGLFVVSIAIAILLLVLQVAPALACPPSLEFYCVEYVNPHGNIIPGNDRPTDVGNIAIRPHNPDGFTTIVSPSDLTGKTVEVSYGDEYDKEHFGRFPFGLVVKWTQIPNSDYKQVYMGTYDSEQGQADAVAYHFFVPGEPWCTVYVDGEKVWEGSCLVPPPPM